MDLTIQAASGIMSVTGAPDGPPMKAGPTLVDFMGGIHLYAAVVTALFERDRSGLGTLCEVAMQETVYSSLASSFEYYHRTGNPPPRTGNRQAGLSTAPYNVYPAADGHVAIHIVTEGHWKNLIKAMGQEALGDDPRFVTNADRIRHLDEIDEAVSAWTRTLPKMEIFARAKAGRIPCAPVRTVPEIMADPHMPRARDARRDRPPRTRAHHRAELAAAPPRGWTRCRSRPAARPGQYNDEIYGGWLGLSDAELAELKEEAGAILNVICHCEEPKATRQSPSGEPPADGDCRVACGSSQ